MTGLRVTHGAFHRTLGLRGRGNDAVMFVLSVLLGGAMHAIECTHRHHHRACLEADDVEGRIAHLGFWRALLHSPLVVGMFHHLEHHLYPAVPTWRLPELAQRFDAARQLPIRTVLGARIHPGRSSL